MIRFGKNVRRGIAMMGVSAAMGVAIFSGASTASASTIPNGRIQICAQGNYSAFIHILSREVSNGFNTGSVESVIVNPGNCVELAFNTDGGWNQVDVVGLNPDHSERYIQSEWWNSNTGLGIGAEGSISAPFVWTW